MLWAALAVGVGVAGYYGWRFWQAHRFATEDEGILLLAVQLADVDKKDEVETLARFVAEERQGEVSAARITFLELLLADALVRSDRKGEALVLFARHLPQPGLWEKYLPRQQMLLKWGLVAWSRGHYRTAETGIDAALACEGPKDGTVMRIKGLVVKKLTADPQETKGWFDRSLKQMSAEELPLCTLRVESYLAGLKADLGDLEGALADFQSALSRFLTVNPTVSEGEMVELGGIRLKVVTALCRLGRMAEARQVFSNHGTPLYDRAIEMEVRSVQLELEAGEGQARASAAELQKLIDEAGRRKDEDSLGEYTLILAHVEALAENPDGARAVLASARELYARLESKSDLSNVECAAKRLGL